VKPGKTFAVRFAGDPIVLVRPKDGSLFALEDRCAHRQVPLSKGAVDGCTIACGYHGWRYDASGACVDVPYLGRGKLPNGVRRYPCFEQDGLIFVWPGMMPAAEPFLRIGGAADTAYKTRRFGRLVHCHYSFMHENLMDMNHQFLHRGIMGTIRPSLLDFRRGDDWVEVRYRFEQAAGKPDRGADLMMGGRRKAEGERRPGDLMTIRTQYPYQTLELCRGGSDQPSIKLWVAYVPYDRDQRSHTSVGMLMIEKPPVPGLIHLFWPLIRRFAESVFTEDRMAVEAEQRAYDQQRGDWNQEINPVILALREVLIANGVPLDAAPAERAAAGDPGEMAACAAELNVLQDG
jgi:phenylpropionate dioxygenase-like ring-hydroxylating dioxygenase large terminal subunit